MFKLLTPDRTGISFANTITTNDSVNVQTDVFVYNGAGVATGDIDNDGLADIFFSGNMVSSRLYLNKGDMRFEDITESAGVTTDRWATGASMADIDNNGYLDIYVSVSGPPWSEPHERRNLLFLNKGDRTFTEAAAKYQIDDAGFTTHAVFFDYDRDGDLDLFLLENDPEDFARGEADRHPAGVPSKSSRSHDQLYRNNGDGTFTNVSREAGILTEVGYGLGVAVADVNRDGWPDIYVSNDDAPSDVLYVNNRNGTFTDKAAAWLKHTSFAGMGVDIADFNNDGWPDILQTDMMPEDLRRRKRMSGATTYAGFVESQRRGFYPAYSVNALQLSNGVTNEGDVIFSEIARLAGVAYTDWSWTALFGDYDNDGYKDILITNGYPKAVTDFDYQTAMFRIRRAGDGEGSTERGLRILSALHSYKVSNYVFRNEGDLTFTNKTKAWGMDHPGFSYGAAHADLNNDGRLDIVVSNIDAPALVYENVRPDGDTHHYLQIRLHGEHPNRRGIGSTLILTAGGQKQYIDHTPSRGYMSTMDDRVHFGLGDARRVDSLEVIWPDGRSQLLTDLEVDRMLTARQGDATNEVSGVRCRVSGCSPRHRTPDTGHLMFQPIDAGRALKYKHQETSPVDYNVQPLLPYMLSRVGPPLAVGDADRNGLDDVFIGGAAGLPGRLFLQKKNGGFVESPYGEPWLADRDHEDWGALFFDANGDGLLDLYVASGGYHFSPVSALLQDRLYVNRGGGRFVKDARALPDMPTSTATVTAGDFTGDGKPDLFVGGRLVPRDYPHPTRSYLLRNDGGTFTDITKEAAPELAQPGGMITAAVWIDFDGDGRLDLVTAGEWMPVQFFKNDGGRLRNVTESRGLPPMRGWWYSLAAGDFNNDGRPDLVAGNLGLNHTFTTSVKSKFGIYAADLTGNRTTDIVLTQEIDGTEYPFAGLATLGRAIYPVGVRFLTHKSFSDASIGQTFSSSQLNQAVHYQADTFASVYLQGNGTGTFTSFALPNLAQISPIKGIIAHDVDGDGNLDLIAAGNLYHCEPNTPRADAGNGIWLKGDGRGNFTPVPPIESGFLAPLDVTGLALINTPTGKAVLVANNGDSLQAFVVRGSGLRSADSGIPIPEPRAPSPEMATTRNSAATCPDRLPGSIQSATGELDRDCIEVSPAPHP
jgi:enediyne biosynthesis protein E4